MACQHLNSCVAGGVGVDLLACWVETADRVRRQRAARKRECSGRAVHRREYEREARSLPARDRLTCRPRQRYSEVETHSRERNPLAHWQRRARDDEVPGLLSCACWVE